MRWPVLVDHFNTAVRLSLPQGARTFGRGECILRKKETRGRPRSRKELPLSMR